MKTLPEGYLRWDGGTWNGPPGQLVQVICPGAYDDEFADVPSPVIEADCMDWRHRQSALYPGQRHHGDILAYRPVGRLQIVITVYDNGENPSIKTSASPMNNDTAALLLDAACMALIAEAEAFEKCPIHRKKTRARGFSEKATEAAAQLADALKRAEDAERHFKILERSFVPLESERDTLLAELADAQAPIARMPVIFISTDATANAVSALKAARPFVEYTYDETDREEAAEAKHVLDMIDDAVSSLAAASPKDPTT